MTDPISDMLTRVRNAQAVGKTEVSFPYSKVKEAIVKILIENGFAGSYEVAEAGPAKLIKLQLTGRQNINALQRISKPGRRLYAGVTEIPSVLGGRGIVIMSTPKGILTGQQARKSQVGGELICRVW